MTVVEAVQAALVAVLDGIVPAARIRPWGLWRDLTAPYVVHRPVAGPDIPPLHSGLATLAVWRDYEVDVFGDSAKDVSEIAVLLRQSLGNAAPEGWAIWPAGGAGLVAEEPAGLLRYIIEFTVAGGES